MYNGSDFTVYRQFEVPTIRQLAFQQLLENIEIYDTKTPVTQKEIAQLLQNPDVALWLNKVGPITKTAYQRSLIYFLKCVKIKNPSALLDLKMDENPRRRFFPAERLTETWIAHAKQNKLTDSQITVLITAVCSFFKHNRAPLAEVSYTYKPKPKQTFDQTQLRQFRENFNFFGKIIFDFLLSVPIRDGQFQVCPHCGRNFHPRWRNLSTYPKIEPYTPFIIKPEKGHENDDKYDAGLMQVCFLTPTAASQLNLYRRIKEKALGRKLSPDEYIVTAARSLGEERRHERPISSTNVRKLFQRASERGPLDISPHQLRTWVNAVLASRGIDKQLRDIYLGHSCSYEEGYVMQMVPQWQETFKKAKAMESIDIVETFISPIEVESQLWQIKELQDELNCLEKELGDKTANAEDYSLAKLLLKKYKQGKIKVVE